MMPREPIDWWGLAAVVVVVLTLGAAVLIMGFHLESMEVAP